MIFIVSDFIADYLFIYGSRGRGMWSWKRWYRYMSEVDGCSSTHRCPKACAKRKSRMTRVTILLAARVTADPFPPISYLTNARTFRERLIIIITIDGVRTFTVLIKLNRIISQGHGLD